MEQTGAGQYGYEQCPVCHGETHEDDRNLETGICKWCEVKEEVRG